MKFVTYITLGVLFVVAASAPSIKHSLLERRQSGVSEADQQLIVDLHNQFRSAVYPQAIDMQKMVWDSTIAESAQSWADNCDGGNHDTYAQRAKKVGYGIAIGQNYAGGSQTWTSAITNWHKEVDLYTYGVHPEDWTLIDAYTAVVWGKAARVGCGYNDCSSSPRFICNYAFSNMGDMTHPYISGTTCADCGTCVDNLCDCEGLICKNGGTMYLNTCTCACHNRYHGDDCGEEYCEGLICKNGGTLNINTCMCACPAKFHGNDCSEEYCKGFDCKNAGTLDMTTCACTCLTSWVGDDCGILACTGSDFWLCKTWDIDWCTLHDYSKYVKPRCPYMCGDCYTKKAETKPPGVLLKPAIPHAGSNDIRG